MRTVSTGTGLVVLSATIAACFVVSHFGGEERAFAQGVPPHAPSASAACVPQGTPWLSPIAHPLSANCGFGQQPISAADVNADGTMDYFSCSYSGDGVVEEGQARSLQGTLLVQSVLALTGSGSNPGTASVFPSAELVGSSLLSQFPNLRSASLDTQDKSQVGWRDMDDDGDLDFTTPVNLSFFNGDSTRILVWFENTGYQASPPPNPYDLDQDGEVGAADIGVLLLNFD